MKRPKLTIRVSKKDGGKWEHVVDLQLADKDYFSEQMIMEQSRVGLKNPNFCIMVESPPGELQIPCDPLFAPQLEIELSDLGMFAD